MSKEKDFFNNIQAGIVSVGNWLMMPDGDEYRYIWCPDWRLITDKEVPKNNFRSSEHWSLLGLNEKGEIIIVIPGCHVKGFIACKTAPKTKTTYRVS